MRMENSQYLAMQVLNLFELQLTTFFFFFLKKVILPSFTVFWKMCFFSFLKYLDIAVMWAQ